MSKLDPTKPPRVRFKQAELDKIEYLMEEFNVNLPTVVRAAVKLLYEQSDQDRIWEIIVGDVKE